jgi:hypothetical protein
MEDRYRDDGFEATFVVSTPRADAWKRLEALRGDDWYIPGIEAPAAELEVVPESKLRARKTVEPCKDTEIVITFEDEETGTRITIVQTGFGNGFSQMRPWLEAGWWAIRADLFAFFEHGVQLKRHARPWASIGCNVEETPGGLVVSHITGGGFAQQAGMQDGDLIVTLHGSPVVSVRELSVLARAFKPDAEFRATYLRDGERLKGSGTL